MREFNEDRTRVITDETGAVFAYLVGYEGAVADGHFEGRHAGIFESLDSGRSWLRGEAAPDIVVRLEE